MNSACRDKIEKRAYELYVERGGTDGFDVDDWLRAEQEVLSAQPAPTARAKPARKASSPTPASGAVKPRSRPKKSA